MSGMGKTERGVKNNSKNLTNNNTPPKVLNSENGQKRYFFWGGDTGAWDTQY